METNVHDGAWKRWFAWRPVEVDGRRVWLRWVERRQEVYGHVGGTFVEEHFREAA